MGLITPRAVRESPPLPLLKPSDPLTAVPGVEETARKLGYGAIVLVGDPEYYSRFGFAGAKTAALWMPGPFERHRLLGRELTAGALDGARGMIAPAGRMAPLPDLAAMVAQEMAKAPRAQRTRGHRPRAA